MCIRDSTYPSLKGEEDNDSLWNGILKSDLAFTATDSSFTTYLDKIAARNIEYIRGGIVGIEIRMGVNYTEAVVKRGMSLERYVDVTSANAAKILGMYPQKGAIAVGSDADFAIIDTSVKKADPTARTIGGMGARPDLLTREFFEAGGLDHLDIFNIHI